MLVRAISTSAARFYAKPKPTPIPLIKKYPVTLHLMYPSWDIPTNHQFDSAEEIKTFLSDPKQFLLDIKTGDVIHCHQIHKIDPNIIYDVAGSGLPYREKGLTRDQVWYKVFERKTVNALKEALQAEDQKLIELPRVVKDPVTGLDVNEWEVIFQAFDGSLIFLETKYRMCKVSLFFLSIYFSNPYKKNTQNHIDKQFKRLSKSLDAMGNEKRAKLSYLAAYHWPDDEDCISYARSKGYGIIQPNGSDLTVHFKAKGRSLMISFMFQVELT